MVHSYRYHQLKKGDRQHVEEEEVLLSSLMCAASSVYFNRTRPKLIFLVILSLLSCCLILSPPLFCSSSLSCKLLSLMGFGYFLSASVFFFLFLFFAFADVCLVFADSFDVKSDGFASNVNAKAYLCSSISNG